MRIDLTAIRINYLPETCLFGAMCLFRIEKTGSTTLAVSEPPTGPPELNVRYMSSQLLSSEGLYRTLATSLLPLESIDSVLS